jgi:thiamine phosphate synthase YjbQ (UPF0047 family)
MLRRVLHQSELLWPTQGRILVRDGRLDLGTWQSLYLYEHRHAPHTRRVSITLVGDARNPRP